MSAWTVLVAADRYAAERLFHHDVLALPARHDDIRPGDRVALVADITPPVVFALATVDAVARDDADDPGADQGDVAEATLVVTYTHRFFDDPRPTADRAPDGPVHALPAGVIEAFERPRSEPSPRTWLVSIDLPIEASSAADAVRQFWTYVHDLGPAELPVFVRPSGDELAMQAFVLGVEANQDPEED